MSKRKASWVLTALFLSASFSSLTSSPSIGYLVSRAANHSKAGQAAGAAAGALSFVGLAGIAGRYAPTLLIPALTWGGVASPWYLIGAGVAAAL